MQFVTSMVGSDCQSYNIYNHNRKIKCSDSKI